MESSYGFYDKITWSGVFSEKGNNYLLICFSINTFIDNARLNCILIFFYVYRLYWYLEFVVRSAVMK